MDKTEKPALKQAHLQTVQSQPRRPKFAKELALPTQEEKQKISLSFKNKTLQAHSPIDNHLMTELIENNKCMSLDKKEGQLVTGGIFYCRDSAVMKGCSSHQTSSWLDNDVLRNRQQKHTAKCCV